MAMGRLWMTDWGWWGVGRQDPRPTRWIEHHRHNILSIIIIVIGTIVVIIVKIQGQRAITNISHRSHRSANRSARTKVSLDCPEPRYCQWPLVRESEKVHNKSRHQVPKKHSLEVVHRETWFVDILSPGHPAILLVIKTSLPHKQGYKVNLSSCHQVIFASGAGLLPCTGCWQQTPSGSSTPSSTSSQASCQVTPSSSPTSSSSSPTQSPRAQTGN